MNRKAMWLTAAVACALAAPMQTLTATSGVPVGSTVTALDLCPSGPDGVSYPGATAPAGCQGNSTGTTTVTICPGGDVHAFVKSQIMVDGKRPSLQPLEGTVAVHFQSATYGSQNNVATSAADGSALLDAGELPAGSYEVRASLWSGSRTAADGAFSTYPSSSATVTLVVPEAPCTQPLTTSGKNGCGVGDANHQHNPKSGKPCPTK
jgi:hypothetical protein